MSFLFFSLGRNLFWLASRVWGREVLESGEKGFFEVLGCRGFGFWGAGDGKCV